MVAVPIAVANERRIVRHFQAEGATSMADAIPFEAHFLPRRRAFDRLKGLDILRTDGRGRWWLDEAKWDERRGNRLARAGMAMLAVAAAAAFAALR